MAQVLVRNVDDRTMKALKRRAGYHRTSLQQELKTILEEASRSVSLDAEAVARRIRENLRKKGISYADSGQSQAEDRLR